MGERELRDGPDAEDRVSTIGPWERNAAFSLRAERRLSGTRAIAFPAPEWESRQNTKPLGVYAVSKFLIEASLTTAGVKGVQSEGGTARRAAVTKAVESVGGRLDSFFFGFGDPGCLCDRGLPRQRERGGGNGNCRELIRRGGHENGRASDA